jgi:TRAP-type C4-dicarboxylate transport system substrate-binding protein
MNKGSYDSLPDDLKQVVDAHSLPYASDMAGIYWDSTRATSIELAAESNVEVYEAPAELVTEFESVKDEVHKQYVEYLNQSGLDGQKIYDQFMEIMAKYNAEYSDPWAEPVLISDFQG